MRGPLAGTHLPVMRSRAERFDDAVLDALEHLEHRWADELAGVQVVVEDVPPAEPTPGPATATVSPAPAVGPDDRSPVPLGRVDPGLRRHPVRLVVYRRPVEARAKDQASLEVVTRLVLTGLVADLLGRTVTEIDPEIADD